MTTHPITRLAADGNLDPLNFASVPRGLDVLAVRHEGRDPRRLQDLRGKTLWDSALIYNAGSWSKRAVLDRTALAAVGGSRFQPAYEAMLAEGRKVTQLRETAVAKASERVATRIRPWLPQAD